MPNVYIIGGGTNFHIRPHLALSAPAYGQTARDISVLCFDEFSQEEDLPAKWSHKLILTKMAGGRYMSETDGRWKYYDTNDDISGLIDEIVADPDAKVVFMSAALCDFEVEDIDSVKEEVLENGEDYVSHLHSKPGKQLPRLKTSEHKRLAPGEWSSPGALGEPSLHMSFVPAEKIIQKIRKDRKDIFLVGFKATTGASPDEQFEAGLSLMKEASCNLVLANDLHTRLNMVITPEQARYAVTHDRGKALETLVRMAAARSQGKFTRSTVMPGDIVPWSSKEIPDSLRRVVDHCISRGAYRPFRGKTVGHFAVKVSDNQYLTSIRKTDFNDLIREPGKSGLVKVEARGDDTVISYGARPSVGGQSQRIIFAEHPGLDCIAHAHAQIRPGSAVPIRQQWMHECGSHECGANTSSGLKEMEPGIWAVMLEKHGFNVVFNRDTDSDRVIDFIERNFDLEHHTSELS